MMGHPALSLTKEATYKDLFDLPENVVGEIIAGELFVSPRPALPHIHASSLMGADLIGNFYGSGNAGTGSKGWWILDEPEIHLGHDILVPDLAGWKKERMPNLPDHPFFTLTPDWVCEIASPSTSSLDRVKKSHIYAREKIPYYWIIDPVAQTLEARKLVKSQWVEIGSFEGKTKAKIEPFQAVEFDLSRWWFYPSQEKKSPTKKSFKKKKKK